MRQRLYVLCIVALTMISGDIRAESPEGYPFLTFDKAMKKSQSEGKLLFVYFGRYGSGYCEKTNREAFVDAEVKRRYTEHYSLAYVDAESGRRLRLPTGERIQERELGTRYNALVTPVFTFMTPQGEAIYRLVGVQRIEDLLEADEKVQAAIKMSAQP